MQSRRRIYITDSGFQWRFTLGFCVASLLASVFTASLFYYLSMQQIETLRWSVHLNVNSTAEILTPLFIQINLFSLVLITILLAVTGKLMLNKISGPIYRLINGIRTMKKGDFSSNIILRRNDEFKDVAQTCENMRLKTNIKYSQFAKRYEEISAAIHEMKIDHARGKLTDESGQTILAMVSDLKNMLSC